MAGESIVYGSSDIDEADVWPFQFGITSTFSMQTIRYCLFCMFDIFFFKSIPEATHPKKILLNGIFEHVEAGMHASP